MTGVELKARIFGGMMRLCGRLPLGFLYGAGDCAAWMLNHVFGYRKGVIYTNIARSFPEKDYGEIKRIADAYYVRMGELAAETVWFGGCPGTPDKLVRKGIYEYTNPELLLRLHADRGIMAMKSHCGNWELFGGMFGFASVKVPDFEKKMPLENLFVAYKPLHNAVSDKIFCDNRIAPIRNFRGLVEDSRLMRHAISQRDRRPVYILNADQYPYQACHFVGEFLNQPTQGMLGGFSLAAKLGFAVVYMREERIERGHYRLTFEVISENAAGQDPEELMRAYYSLLEADIRKDPVNWLWSHKRWRK